MKNEQIITKIRGIFHKILKNNDSRCKVQPVNFLAALVCSFATCDGRKKSLSAMRKSMISLTQIKLSRGTFWGRMATKRMKKLLEHLINHLMNHICISLKIGDSVLKLLNVSHVFLLDSSSITLKKGAKDELPAPRNNVVPAAVKVHLLYDLFGGVMRWFKLSPGTTHDRKCFPSLKILKKALIIFDLGYWDFQLMKDIIDAGVFFLSRVKSNAKVKIVDVVEGVSKTCIGFELHSGRLDKFRGKIVEITGAFKIPKTKESFQTRIIGCWCTKDHAYHWYATNLQVSSTVIYSLYRLRWQLELFFKGWKSFLHIDEISSEKKSIILNIIMIGMCAGLIAGTIAIAELNKESDEKQAAFSVQRGASLLIRIGERLFDFLKKKCRRAKKRLLETIELFRGDLYDPNHKKRKGSVCQVWMQSCEI